MLILPVTVIIFLFLVRRTSSQVALVTTLASVFFWYEFSLFFLPFFRVDVFNVFISNLIQLAPIAFVVALVIFSPKFRVTEKKAKKISNLRVELLYQIPSITILVLLVMSFLKLGLGSMAFATSGDARNHVWFSRFIIEQKGLNASSAAYYPVLPDGMVALTRSGLDFYSNLAKNMLSLDLIAIGMMTLTVLILMSQVHIAVGKSIFKDKHSLKITSILILAFLPLGALVSKVALGDGFYPALFACLILQLFCLASISFFDSNNENEKTLLLISIILLFPLIVSTWTILLILPGVCILLLPAKFKIMIMSKLKNQRELQIVFLFSCALLFLNLAPLLKNGAAANYVKSPGAISLPPAFLMLTTLVAFFAYFFWGSKKYSDVVMQFLGTALFTTLITFGFLASLQDNGNYWNYYPAKFTWIVLITMFPFLICFSIREFSRNPGIHSIILVPLFVLLSWSITNSPWIKLDVFTSNRPQSIIYSGWYSPSAVSINQVLNYGTKNVPIVFWDLADPSGDRLANFWLATYLPVKFDNPVLATNLLRDWAYFEIPGQPDSLCNLLENSDLRWNIITKNQKLTQQLAEFCMTEVSQNEVVLLKK